MLGVVTLPSTTVVTASVHRAKARDAANSQPHGVDADGQSVNNDRMRQHVVRSDGSVALPRDLLERANLAAGARVQILAVDGGLLITPAPQSDQAWYWTEAWQAGEREADDDARLGRSTVYESDEVFIAHLRAVHDELAAQGL